MSSSKSLLVELFAEELPPKALKKLGDSFAHSLAAGLKARGLTGEHATITAFATPRRLAAHISDVKAVADDAEITEKLMPSSVALKDGSPTEALRKRLAKMGRQHLADLWSQGESGPEQWYEQGDDKAKAVYLRRLAKGTALHLGLQNALDEALAQLPIPKLMSYQLADGWKSVQFARPVHGLLALHGANVVPVTALGLVAGRQTRGHRFEGPAEPLEIEHADDYALQLERRGAVIPGFADRRAEVLRQLHQAAARQGLRPIDDPALLDEVTALVERPNVLACRFEADFLSVPAECLVLTMKANQKYFPLLDEAGRLTEQFLVVSNIRPADPRHIIEGNQRVVRPRLADARFFYDQDRKLPLPARLPALDKVVYHGKLGTQGARVRRVRAIARPIAHLIAGRLKSVDGAVEMAALAALADRAAELAKADLVSGMVGEFPELQGVMGAYYARHDGEPEAVAHAIEDHYKPRFAGDTLPRSPVGLVVALADKLETLAGLFSAGERPTGDKDPYALRRHALGVVRMLIERALPLSIQELMDAAFAPFTGAGLGTLPAAPQARVELVAFIEERLAGYLRELGYSPQQVDAVLSARAPHYAELPRRLAAVRDFATLPEAASLAAANKRIGNILRKSDAKPADAVDASQLVEPAERALAAALKEVGAAADAAFGRGDHAANLRQLAAMKAPVDAFFDSVMVNADEPALRANRLALLSDLHAAMNRVADLSKLAV